MMNLCACVVDNFGCVFDNFGLWQTIIKKPKKKEKKSVGHAMIQQALCAK
jgi:hypothetical protein